MSENEGNTPDSNIVFIKNKDATKHNIIKQSKEIFSKGTQNDRVFFYFSGHGSKGFFCAYDRIPKDEYLYFSEIKDIFKSAKCNIKILFANSCHAGSLMDKVSEKNNKHIAKEIAELKKDTTTNIAIMLSSKGNKSSWGGIFSRVLNLGLRGNADSNNDSIVTIKELFYFVHEKTLKDAAIIGRVQTPILFGNFNLNLVVGGNYNKNPLYYRIDDNDVYDFFLLE